MLHQFFGMILTQQLEPVVHLHLVWVIVCHLEQEKHQFLVFKLPQIVEPFLEDLLRSLKDAEAINKNWERLVLVVGVVTFGKILISLKFFGRNFFSILPLSPSLFLRSK